MDRHWHQSLREDRLRKPTTDHHTHSPSFSSTLLDTIYRSIDADEGHRQEQLLLYRSDTMRKKNYSCHGGQSAVTALEAEEEMARLRRAIMIEKWMEKKVGDKVVVCRQTATAADFEAKPRRDRERHAHPLAHSSSSSSESSCGGGFSSSEAESVHGVGSRSSGFFDVKKLKPVRTGGSSRSEKARTESQVFDSLPKPKREGGFVKTKSKALKIYGDLKKAKQPISPGGKLASFLNSLFTAGNAKKAKISSSSLRNCDDASWERNSKSAYGSTSTCSSASSFSRSCLSKTPSSRGKLSNGAAAEKRSVRFYPVSVIVDEDSRPCGHKNLYGDEESGFVALTATVRNSAINDEVRYRTMENNRRAEEAARVFLKNYQKKGDLEMRDLDLHQHQESENDGDDDEDDDAASCSSSDLFELDHLSVVGIDRYHEELPVYETTRLDTNRAIASGLIL
ncbi:protein BIG GRAIN 1-like A [Malania oleifera]|uniref:protein BIG GRAIN 1-like A n=1 Tax=Malania oleifera TaxID=397392 RepID=UPI0025ADBE23|nr:protein BIG GRAIN 1-like A [Malania oleifera]